MTNAEKAKKIADSKYTYDINRDNCEHYDCYLSAMEMAKWKERQIIKKATKWLEENCRYYTYDDLDNMAYIHTTALIKDFKKAMKE